MLGKYGGFQEITRFGGKLQKKDTPQKEIFSETKTVKLMNIVICDLDV